MIVRPQLHSVNTDKRKEKTQTFFFSGVVSAGVVAVGLVVSSSLSLVGGDGGQVVTGWV
jgi:hypothetical protein